MLSFINERRRRSDTLEQQQQRKESERVSERESERGKYPLSEREFRERERERALFNGESTFVLPNKRGQNTRDKMPKNQTERGE